MAGSQNRQILEFAEKQPMNIDDFREIYLFKPNKEDEDVHREIKEFRNKEICDFIDEYIRPIADEDGHAPSGMLQYYIRLWTDKDFYLWYGKEHENVINRDLEELKIKSDATAEIFKQDMEVLARLDPKILNTQFHAREILGKYTKKSLAKVTLTIGMKY